MPSSESSPQGTDDEWDAWLGGVGCYPPVPGRHKGRPYGFLEQEWFIGGGSNNHAEVQSLKYITDQVVDIAILNSIPMDQILDLQNMIYGDTNFLGRQEVSFLVDGDRIAFPIEQVRIFPMTVTDLAGVTDVVWVHRHQNWTLYAANAGHAWCPAN